MSDPANETLLEVEHLTKRFPVKDGWVTAVDDISLSLKRGETLALVGESGSGKTTTGMSILRLNGCVEGSIRFQGREIASATRRQMRPIRRRLQLVMQEPVSALNPRRPIEKLVAEGLRWHPQPAGQDNRQKVMEAIRRVGFTPEDVMRRRAGEFSGGQCQRIAIARALVLQPLLLVCDEPVASLDVSIQGQILNLLEDMRQELGLSMLFISHDLTIVKSTADRVAVMYLGRIVEEAPVEHLFSKPRHPYTRTLLNAIPEIAKNIQRTKPEPASADIDIRPRQGCGYAPRCPIAREMCRTTRPELRTDENGVKTACHFPLSDGQPILRQVTG